MTSGISVQCSTNWAVKPLSWQAADQFAGLMCFRERTGWNWSAAYRETSSSARMTALFRLNWYSLFISAYLYISTKVSYNQCCKMTYWQKSNNVQCALTSERTLNISIHMASHCGMWSDVFHSTSENSENLYQWFLLNWKCLLSVSHRSS